MMTKITFILPFMGLLLCSTSVFGQTISVAPKLEAAPAAHERAFEEMTLTYRVQQVNGLWTFEVLGDESVLFTQAEVLENTDKQGLSSRNLAEKAAKLAMLKVKTGTYPPSITTMELTATKND
ncbi:MAG: DUF4907 domain-containing protein [Bacteroidia bacterium]